MCVKKLMQNNMKESLIMIGNDRLIFDRNSAVAKRQIEYAKDFSEVHIIVFTNKHYHEIALSHNVWVYPTRSLSKLFYVTDAINLAKFIIKNKKITKITTQDPWLAGMVGVSLKKDNNINLEIQIHGDIGSEYFAKNAKNKFLKLLALSNIPKADHIRVVSNNIKTYLTRSLNIDEAKIEIRPIIINTDLIKVQPIDPAYDLHKKYRQFSKIILMSSRLEKEKNIKLAIESVKYLVSKEQTLTAGLIIVGDGSQKNSLEKYVRACNLEKYIVFEPWIEFQKLISYYKTCDIFLSTSDYEGYGMTFVEANAAGAQIVSTDVGIAKEIGAAIVNRIPEEISETILTLLEAKKN